MLRKIIIIENGEEIQCDTLEEVVRTLIDTNYYNMSHSQRMEKMKMKALANCINNNREIIQEDLQNSVNDLDKKFIINDEFTYIYSLLMTNNLLLLERKDSNIFTKDLAKDNLNGNYVVVNTFAKELLIKYVNN